MHNELIFQDVVSMAPPLRRKRHAAKSLPAVDRILEEIGSARDPVLGLVSCLAGQADDAEGHRADWAQMVRGHALDLYADAGMDALAWPQALAEALHVLVRLRSKFGPSDWMLQVQGLTLEVSSSNPPKPRASTPLPPGAKHRTLTMKDVDRELSRRPPLQALRDAEEVCDLLPDASLPLLALATGALQALAVAGRLTGFERMTLGDSRIGWTASVHWPDAAKGEGPSGPPL